MLLACMFWGIHVSSFLGSRLVAPSTSQSGVCFGSLMISEYASAMGLWRLLNCLIQKLGSLPGPGDFQLAALVHVDPVFFNCEVHPVHMVDLLQFFLLAPLIHWATSLCLTSYSSMFCQNFFTSPMSGGFSIWMVFFPSSL